MKRTMIVLALLLMVCGVFAQTILHYWNFNNSTPATDTNWTQPIAAAQGTGQIAYTFSEAWSFTGTTINGVTGEVNGGSFCPRGGVDNVNNGAYFTITAPTTSMDNIVMTYATRRTTTGFNSHEVKYTIDGSTWLTKETLSLVGFENNWVPGQMFTVDFTGVTGVANNPNFAIRMVLTGATSATGNNRFDNIQITGSSQSATAVPVFTPPAGVYNTPQSVALSCATPNATIYYTTNGSDPTTSSTLYSTPIQISSTSTIKARAYATGFDPSPIAIAVYTYPVLISNLASLRNQAADNATVYQVPNEVILTFKSTSRNQKYVQDASAAILIDDASGIITSLYNIGDGISGIAGKLSMYFETLQFIPTANPGPATSTNNNVFEPTVTIAELNSDIGVGAYQSRLVRINNVHFDSPSGNYSTEPIQNLALTDATGTMTFRTSFYNVDYLNTPMHTGTFNLRGLIAHYQSNAQITPRMLADFNPPSSNEDDVLAPANAKLIGNFPNPFNPNTTIQFSLIKASPANIDIFNHKGQLVKSFRMEQATQGINNLHWNGTDNAGNVVSSGVYYFRLMSGTYSSTKKMVLMK